MQIKKTLRNLGNASLFSLLLAGTAAAGTLEVDPFDYTLDDIAVTIDTTTPVGITIIDRASQKALRSLRFPGSENVSHFANLTAEGELWACRKTGADGFVAIYDIENLALLKDFPEVGCGIQSALSRDGKWIFFSKPGGVNIFDVENQLHLGQITTNNNERSSHVGDALAATDPGGNIYWTTDAADGNLLGYDISTLPVTPPHHAAHTVAIQRGTTPTPGNLHALRIHPEGRYIFVGRGGSGEQAGVYVVDSQASPAAIVGYVPGSPHNFAISPDGNYLASSENGSRLQLIDISSLKGPNPDPAAVAEIYELPHQGFGGNHQSWDEDSGLLLYTVSRSAAGDPQNGEGQLWFINTEGLDHAQASVSIVKKIPVGRGPHSPVFSGKAAD